MLALPQSWQSLAFPDQSLFDPRMVLATTGAVMLLAGVVAGDPVMVGGGAAGLCLLPVAIEQYAAGHDEPSWRLASRLLRSAGAYGIAGTQPPPAPKPSDPSNKPSPPGSDKRPEDEEANQPDKPTNRLPPQPVEPPGTTAEFLNSIVRTGRYALLLREETAGCLSATELDYLQQVLDQKMALVPAGPVLVGMTAEQVSLGQAPSGLGAGDAGRLTTGEYYLDRLCVTNADFKHFVDAGGYQQANHWTEAGQAALFEFVDQTGRPGPRWWVDGCFDEHAAELPVVGVCWHEAVAYARWAGKRLPTDAEWTKAAASPVASATGDVKQRRYPWGESFDAQRANLWAAGFGGPAPVDAFAIGDTVGGLRQMIGNTWEWVADTLDAVTPVAVEFPDTLQTIRGGAFNTYFENQATSHFQSAEPPLSRRDNIGIRLALDVQGIGDMSCGDEATGNLQTGP